MILERVTFVPPRPPVDYSIDVAARWQAMKVAYRLLRNREPRRG